MADILASHNLDLTEAEFAALLAVCEHGAAWERTRALLLRIGRELTTLSAVRPSMSLLSPCMRDLF